MYKIIQTQKRGNKQLGKVWIEMNFLIINIGQL